MITTANHSRNACLWAGLLTAFVMMATAASPAYAASDAEVIRGFNLTAFGAEYSGFGRPSDYVRKFSRPVRFHIHNLSARNREPAVRRFILSLNRSIHGLQTSVVARAEQANFNVYVVDRKDYADVVRREIYRRPTAPVRGKCLVRSNFSRRGISRSDAVIVSDEGEAIFKRCLAEEILQGLGPLNEDSSLSESIFNDASQHTGFTRFDRLILNMLYDERIKNGASKSSVQRLLPDVLRDAKRRVR